MAEEALFRGLLQRPLRDTLLKRSVREGAAAWLAIVLVNLLFGLAHFAVNLVHFSLLTYPMLR